LEPAFNFIYLYINDQLHTYYYNKVCANFIFMLTQNAHFWIASELTIRLQ